MSGWNGNSYQHGDSRVCQWNGDSVGGGYWWFTHSGGVPSYCLRQHEMPFGYIPKTGTDSLPMHPPLQKPTGQTTLVGGKGISVTMTGPSQWTVSLEPKPEHEGWDE